MKTKFSKKLLSMFLAVLMVLSVMGAGFSAFAATPYVDDAVDYNSLGWAELTDEQLATAILDQLDILLADVGPQLDDMIGGALGGMWDANSRQLDVYGLIKLPVKLHSVDEVLDTLGGAHDLIHGALNAAIGGDVKNVNLSAGKGVTRAGSGDTAVIQAIFKLLRDNIAPTNTILKEALQGTFDLGIFSNFIGGQIYPMLEGTLNNIPSGYEQNLVNNIIVHLVSKAFNAQYQIANNSNGKETFTFADYDDGGSVSKTYTIDEYMFKLLSEALLQQINIEITYAGGISSRDHYAQILEYMSQNDGSTQADAAKALGYDPGLIYTENGNVYLFRYDNPDDAGQYSGEDDIKIELKHTDSLFDFGYQALEVAWKTALKPTLNTLDSTTKNYDNDYHDWSVENKYSWNYDNVESNYETSQVQAWAAARGYTLDDVKDELDYNREIIDEPTYTWHDIDSTVLFNELRYSPLMQYYFKAATGPLNLAFECTGFKNIEEFMSTKYSNYTSIVGGLCDFLVAAIKDLFPNYPKMETLNEIGDTKDGNTISNTIVSYGAAILQWLSDETNKNILSAFYHKNGDHAVITEKNLEEALIPFVISALQNVTIADQIHDYEWDACKDAEGVAAVALKEYLSYILPDLDYSAAMTKDDQGYYNVTLEDAVLPMCRDAVGYVMYQYVPLSDKNGNPWNVYESKVEDDVTVFDLLNSVIYHYGNEMGVGKMLGLVDESGNCPISLSKSIWENLDLVANKFFPIIGELQYGTNSKYGKCSTEDLIYNDIVLGVLEIGDSNIHSSTNKCGISNFINNLVNFICANPISEQSADVTVYNFLKDLLNGLFTARQGGQYENPVPDATTTPFNDLVQVQTITGAEGNGNDIGVIGKALVNLCEFTGINNYRNSLLPGALFLIQSVNSFLHFIPTIDDYMVDAISFDLKDSAFTSYSYGNFSTTLSITNEGSGINRAIIDKDGEVVQLGRSFIKVNGVSPEVNGAPLGTIRASYNSNENIAPSKALEVSISGSVGENYFDDKTDCVVTYKVVYSIVDSAGDPVAPQYENLEKQFYQYFTSEQDWYDLTYDSSGNFKENLNSQSGAQKQPYSTMTGKLNSGTGNVCLQFPNNIVVKASEASQLANRTRVRIRGANRAGDANLAKIYAVNSGTYSDTAANNNVAVSIDTLTGNIVNVFYSDYYVQYYDESGAPKAEGSGWVTEALDAQALANKRTELADQNAMITETRFHIICEYANIDATYGSHIEEKNADGTFNNIYVPYSKLPSGTYDAQTNMNIPSLSAGVPGLVFCLKPETYSGNVNTYTQFIMWDGQTQLKAVNQTIGLGVDSTSTQKLFNNIVIAVCDDSESSEIQSMYNDGVEFLSNYNPNDFSDAEQGEFGFSSKAFSYYQDSLAVGLSAMATAVRVDNAANMASVKANFANTEETTSFYGDAAMKPLTTSDQGTPASLITGITMSDGYYYQTDYTSRDNNPESTKTYANPIYKMEPLTDGDVSGISQVMFNGQQYQKGTDAAGAEVVKVDDVWYLLNAPVYEKEWIETDAQGGSDPVYLSRPYQQDTEEQATNDNGELLYAKKTYVYRDEAGNKVTSRENPKYKLAETNYEIVPGPANRSVFAVALDRLNYAYDVTFSKIESKGADTIYKNVTVLRDGLNNIDFNIVSYENMVKQAREAESIISVDHYYDYEYEGSVIFSANESEAQTQLDAYNEAQSTQLTLADLTIGNEDTDKAIVSSTASSFQIIEALRVFNNYMKYVLERGYVGDKLEDEIKCAAAGKTHDGSEGAGDYTNITVDLAQSSYTIAGSGTYTATENLDGVEYTQESWDAFLAALDEAVKGATLGQTTYGHKDADYYVPQDKDNYTLENSDVYTLKTNLMRAENNLTEVQEANEFKVSGQVVVLINPNSPDDTSKAKGLDGVEISIENIDSPVATTGSDGNFEFMIANGVYNVTLHHKNGYDRTVTLTVNGKEVTAAPVTLVNCDYDHNGRINATDSTSFRAGYKKKTDEANLNRDSSINASDNTIFKSFLKKNDIRKIYTSVEWK